MSSLLPPSASAQERAMDGAISRLGDAAPDYGRLWSAEDCPAEFLPWLAWALSVDFWRWDLPDDVKRSLIQGSFDWHRRKGTPWAVTWLLSHLGFSDVEIIEYTKARKQYEDLGGAKLDGTWKIVADGDPVPRKLIANEVVTGLPYMEHWAQFAVRINLLEASRPGWVQEIKWAVETAKNARSWPVWAYWMLLEVFAGPSQDLSLFMLKEISQPYPWCSPRLDASWKIGHDARRYKLDGAAALDGTWPLGGIIVPAMPYEHLRQCNTFFDLTMKKEIERRDRYIAARLGEAHLRLGRHWQVGANRILALCDSVVTKETAASASPGYSYSEHFGFDVDYPASARRLQPLARLGWRRLDGSWGVGGAALPLPLNGTWKIRRPGIGGDALVWLGKAFDCATYVTLGRPLDWVPRPRLDGSWRLDGRERILAGLKAIRKKLDGSWRIGEARAEAEISRTLEKSIDADVGSRVDQESHVSKEWSVAYPASRTLARLRRLVGFLKLDGSWRVGASAGPALDGAWGLGRDVSVQAGTEVRGFLDFAGGIFRKLGRAEARIGQGWSRKLDGRWALGAFNRLDGSWQLDGARRLMAARMGRYFRRLDGSWKIGATKALDGSWKIGAQGPECSMDILIRRLA